MLAGEPISPRDIRKLLRQDDGENFGGLAFLNACQTAEAGAVGSFFEAFHSVGFAGMIGTEHQTVDRFANPLGIDFLEAFLDRGEPVGSALRNLRGRVPLGLLYGTYCPPDIRVDRGSVQDGFEVRQVHVRGVALSAGPAAQLSATAVLPPLPLEPYRSLDYYDRETGRCLPAATTTANDSPRCSTMRRRGFWCCTARAGWANRRSCARA